LLILLPFVFIGGLGLLLADEASRGEIEAYGIIAGIVWLAFVAFSIWSDAKRPPKTSGIIRREGIEDSADGTSEKSR
jgi:hypothetical protein